MRTIRWVALTLSLLGLLAPTFLRGADPNSVKVQLADCTLESCLQALQRFWPFEVQLPAELRAYPLGAVSLQASSAAEAVNQLLEGVPINYGAQFSQGRLQRLVIVGLQPVRSTAADGRQSKEQEESIQRATRETGPPPAPVQDYVKREREEPEEKPATPSAPVVFMPSGGAKVEAGEGSGGAAEAGADPTQGVAASGSAHEAFEKSFGRNGLVTLSPAELQRRAEEWRRFWMEGGPRPQFPAPSAPPR